VDQADDKERALDFLKQQKATFANYLLDEEDTKVWQEHWDIGGPPAVCVYGRDGKLVRRFVNDANGTFTYADVEKLVRPLLAK
jgi:hypothetical protein